MPKTIISGPGEVLQLDLDAGVEYRSIPEFVNYAVGDDGSVWSRKTRGAQVNFGPWRKLRFSTDVETKRGNLPYFRVALSNIKSKQYRVHLVVLTVFKGKAPPGMIARHKDGHCQNNRLSNLEWGTQKQNASDALSHGTAPRGELCGKSILTTENVVAIRDRRKRGETPKQLASAFDVSRACIYNVLNRQRWWYVP